MRVIGKEDLLEPLNREALKIAKKVATPKGSKPNLMAGNISNSNIWKHNDSQLMKLKKCFQKWLDGQLMKVLIF